MVTIHYKLILKPVVKVTNMGINNIPAVLPKTYYFAHYYYISLDPILSESMTYTTILSRKLRSTQ